MEDLSKLCFECMGLKGDREVCPYCGSAEKPKQPFPLLPLGSLVGGRYYIGKATAKNSEGITYIAYDRRDFRPCSVREFFPESLAVRDADQVTVYPAPGSDQTFGECREAFNEMWKKLQRLKGLTSLINVTDVFAADNTSYAVYEETGGKTLRDYLLSTAQGFIEWEQARILFMPVLSTLGTLHTSGVIHKGINPDAFLLTPDGKLKLTGFSIPQVRLAFGDLEADIADGYAPIEVYSENGKVGTWTDIYAFSAVLYRTLVGTTPIPAPVRAQNDQMMIPAVFAEKLPPYVINALINGMQIDPEDRTRNVEQLRSNLSASPRAVSASASVYKHPDDFNMPVGDVRNAPGTVAPGGDVPASQPPRMGDGPRRLIDELDDPPAAPGKEGGMSASAQNALAEQEAKQSKRKKLTALLVILIVLLVAGIGLLVSALFGDNGAVTPPQPSQTEAPQNITVPNFVGALYDSVAYDSYYSEYLHIIKVEDSSTTVPAGQIMHQSIGVGTSVKQGAEIILTVSTGPKSFAVPDVTGRTYEEALAVLSPQGLVCVKASKYNDGTHAPDTVAETFPPAGESIKQGESIQVILWSGMPDTQPATNPQQNENVQPSDAQTAPAEGQQATEQPANNP